MSPWVFRALLAAGVGLVALVGLFALGVSLRETLRSQFVITVAWKHLRVRPLTYVAVSIIVLIAVLYLLIISVLEGFKAHNMEALHAIHADLTVRVGNYPDGILRPESWAAEMRKVPGVRGVTIGLEIPMVVQFDRARTVGTLRGVDLDTELQFGRLSETLSPPDLKEFGVYDVRGKALRGCVIAGPWRKQFKLRVNQLVTFLFTRQDPEGRDEDDACAVQCVIKGFLEGKGETLEGSAYVDRKFLSEKMRLPVRHGTPPAKTLSLWVEGDPDRPDLDEIRQQVKARMGEIVAAERPQDTEYQQELRVDTWREKYSNLYHALSRENQIMRFIMGFFLLFVAVIIMLILGRLVAEKVRDIGSLRALGATPGGIMACFLAQGLFIALAGLALGLPLALLLIGHVNPLAEFFGLDVFPTGLFLVDQIPTRLLPLDIEIISALTLGAGLLGALLPAYRAARMNPVECLRHE